MTGKHVDLAGLELKKGEGVSGKKNPEDLGYNENVWKGTKGGMG